MMNEFKIKPWFRKRDLGRRLRIEYDSGQALLEFAILLPVALALLTGIMEIGRYANACIVVSHAARAGVQYAAQNRVTASNDAAIIQAAENDAPSFSNMTVTPSHYCTCANGTSSTCQPTDCSGSRIIEYSKVDTQVQLQSITGYFAFPQTYTVKGEKVMRVSQ